MQDGCSVRNAELAPHGIVIRNAVHPEWADILSRDALAFVAKLQHTFGPRREQLLGLRAEFQEKLNSGVRPDFLSHTRDLRQDAWKVALIPDDLADRRVEITGPVTRKMIINALNSGANVYMADFEDSHAPRWRETIEGQVNLRDAIMRQIDFDSPDGKRYALQEKTATLFVRPRGWHLVDQNIWVDKQPVSASLLDFGLFFYHNAKILFSQNKRPYFYIPKLENHLEARLWNDVFVMAQKELGIPVGTIRATVLIETILAVFEMDEILYELCDHSAGLNCGRWDYIFSYIKKFHKHPQYVFPDRSEVTMDVRFLNSYVKLLIHTCHRRGTHAMGGMAAYIPVKDDTVANQKAIAKVEADKVREVTLGHDGTWVAHPGLIPVAKAVFDRHMPTANQIHTSRGNVAVTADDLLAVPKGSITPEGLHTNVSVGLRYLEAWLRGIGCVPIFNLMEDTATAEICRAQIWQWIHHPSGKFSDGTKVTSAIFRDVLQKEMDVLRKETREQAFSESRYELAAQLLTELVTDEMFTDFLTLRAYDYLESNR